MIMLLLAAADNDSGTKRGDTIIQCHCMHKIIHDDVIKWKHFPRYWPFARGIRLTKASDAEL